MAVASVDEKSSLSSGILLAVGSEYTRCFLVTLNQHTDGASVALNAGDLPDRGEGHPDDHDFKCYKLTPAIINPEDDLQWHIYAHYRTETESTPQVDPLDDAVRTLWGSWSYTEVLAKDKDAAAVENAAGQPFDPPLEIERHAPMVTITRNEATYYPATADSYRDSVNSDSTTIAGLAVTARQAYCIEYGGESALRNGVWYFVVTYQIAFKAGTWDRVVLNIGMNTINGVRVKEFDTAGALTAIESQVPLPLAANGTQNAWDADPTYITVYANAQKAFSALGLNI